MSDFDLVANMVGSENIVKWRNEIYMQNPRILELIKEFEKHDGVNELFKEDHSLKEFHELVWYIYTVYNRIGFVLSEDSKFRDKYIKFHGPTLGKLFLVLHGLISVWEKKYGALNYPYLQEIANHIQNDRKEMWNEILNSIKISKIDIYNEKGVIVRPNELENFKVEEIDRTKYEKTGRP